MSRGKQKRMTKAMIYALHGITYKDDHILAPWGEWIRELLKEGNDKTGRKVLTWSMLAGTENGGTCICNCKGCYAKTGNYRFKGVKESLRRNTLIVNEHIDFFKAAVMAQLEYAGESEIRIHASGDFNTKNPEEYAAAWHFIAASFPQDAFWTYTKIERFETLFNDLDNANIVKSLIPEKGVNYGHCDYIMELYWYLKGLKKDVYICRCGIDDNQHCEKCGHCSKAEYVLFIEHSTEYVAKDDPLFPDIVALIESQDNGNVFHKTA